MQGFFYLSKVKSQKSQVSSQKPKTLNQKSKIFRGKLSINIGINCWFANII